MAEKNLNQEIRLKNIWNCFIKEINENGLISKKH